MAKFFTRHKEHAATQDIMPQNTETKAPPATSPRVDGELGDPYAFQHHLDYRRVIPVTIGLALGWTAQQQLVTTASSVISDINADIGPMPTYTWMASAYSMSTAIIWAFIGPLSDILGRRWFFIFGNILAVIGGIVCSTAHSVRVVIIGMAFLGAGAAHQQMALAALAEIYPNKHRGLVQGLLEIAPLPFSACGSLIAHSMVKHATWRWAYYLNIILSALALIVMTIFYFPPVPHREKSRLQLLKNVDFIGCLLFLIGLSGFLLGVSWAGGQFGWGTSAVLVPMILGIATLFAFGVWENYGAKQPLFPPVLFRNFRGFVNVLLVTFVAAMPMYALLSIWPAQVGALYTQDPIKIGVYGMPLGFGTEFGAIAAGLFIKLLGRTNYQLGISTLILTIFIGLMATLTPHDIKPAFAYLLFGGFGITYAQITSIVVIQLSTADEHIGKATGILSVFRNGAGAVAISIYNTIIQTRVKEDLPGRVTRAVLPLGLPETSLPLLLGALVSGDASAAATIPGITPEIINAALMATKYSYAAAFRIIYYVALALGVLATVAAIFTNDITPKMTNHLAVDLGDVDHSAILDEEEQAREVKEVI